MEDPALRESERRYRLLCEMISDYAYELRLSADQAARLVWATATIEALTGYGPDELNAVGPLGVVHLEDLPIADQALASAREGETVGGELRLVRRDGDIVWIRFFARGEPVDGAPGEVRVFGAAQDITERKRLEAEQRRLETQLATAEERERQRIAADIHDEPLQALAALSLRIAALRKRHNDRPLEVELAKLENTVELAVRQLRQLVFDLRPQELDREGLGSAVRRLVEDRVPTHELTVSVHSSLPREPQGEVASVAFRIVQEALTNTLKHAEAGHVDVTLEERGGGFAGVIQDDGGGFDPEAVPPGHFGLDTMRERAKLVGGWCRITSTPGEGTRVEYWMPFAAIGPGR